MAFLDRLLPAWRHRDADVRAAAVRGLGSDAQDVLASLARADSDPRVRRIAVKKLDDPDLLLEIGHTDPDDDLRQLARARAEELLLERATADRPIADCLDALTGVTRPSHRVTIATRAAHRDVRRAALGTIADEPSLAEIARRGDDAEIGVEALARIGDVALLQRIAARDAPPAVALAALARIDDPVTLQAIAEDRQAQKPVRKHARAMLAAIRGDDHPMRAAARRERLTQLCIAVERLIDAADPEAAFNALRAAERDWQDVAAPAVDDPTLQDRFRRACAAARESITRAAQQRDAAARRTAAHRDTLRAREQLCETIEALNGAETPAAIAAARAAWQALGPIDDVDGRDLNTRFTLAMERCAQRYQRWQARDAFRAQLEALVQQAEQLLESRDPRAATRSRAALERRWAALAASPNGVKWLPDERALQRRFVEAGEALSQQEETLRSERQQRAHAARAHLEALCQRLEQLAQRDTATPAAADRAAAAAADADAHLRLLPAAEREVLRHRLTLARQSLEQRVDAVAVTHEWQRWANAEVQQQLIQQAEALLASNDPQRMLREGGRLDQEWQRAAVAPPEHAQALWHRFRGARRELRRRADAYLAENLARKEALCGEVEALADSTDWNTTAVAIRRMQAEWQQIGPVRQHLSAELFARFRAPANRFFERYKEHRRVRKEQYEERLGRMQTLCEAAETLVESTDWDVTAAEMKRLQRDAGEIWGRRPAPVAPEGQELRPTDRLHQRFAAAANSFFDRFRRRDALELEAKLTALESILMELDSLRLALAGPEPPVTEVVQRCKERLAEWARVGPLPPERADMLNQRLQAACDAIDAAYPGSLPEGALDAESNVSQREKLCVRLERLAAAVAVDVDRPSDVAERLKLALAARTIGGQALAPGDQARREAQEAAQRLRDKWQRLGPVIGTRARALAERFAKTDARISELCRED
jgi:hypothetical protein